MFRQITTGRLLIAGILGIVASCGGEVLNDVGDLPGKPDASSGAGGTVGVGTGGTTAGTGGTTAGTGGSISGSGGVGGVSGGSGAAGTCGCSNVRLSIERNGGEGCAVDFNRSSFECDTYELERRYSPSFGIYAYWPLCSGQLAPCGSAIADVGDLAKAIEHPDVQAAVSKAPVFYGSDPRRTTGERILQLTIGAALIEIGADCGAYPGCVSVPQGVVELVALLRALEEQELSEGSCLNRCPSPPNAAHVGETCYRYGQECPWDGFSCALYCENGTWITNSKFNGSTSYSTCQPANVGGAAGDFGAAGAWCPN